MTALLCIIAIGTTPAPRDWVTPDGLVTATYVYRAFDDVCVELESGLRRKLSLSSLSGEDRDYVELRMQLAKRRKPRVRVAESRKNFFKGDPGRRAYWAQERLRRRAQTIAKFNAVQMRGQLAAMMNTPLGYSARLSSLYNGPQFVQRRSYSVCLPTVGTSRYT